MNRDNLMWTIVISVLLSYALFSDASALVPKVYINETGNLTNTTLTVNGTLVMERYFEYRALRILIGDVDYYNATVFSGENVTMNFTGNATHRGINEKMVISRYLQNVTKEYNLTNLFNTTANVSMKVELPNASDCAYSFSSLNFTSQGFSVEGQIVYINMSFQKNESKLINITCDTPYMFGTLYFPAASYNITVGDDLFNKEDIKVLPDAVFSTTKEMYPNKELDYDDPPSLRNWTIHFNFINDANLSINITRIHLWATSILNTTEDPNQNKIYDVNFSACSSGNTVLDKDDDCYQNGMFNSYYVPVVWSEVFFDNMFDFRKHGFYTLEGRAQNYSLTDFFLQLIIPPNMTIVDINYTINMTYQISNLSDCSLLTNVSGGGLAVADQHFDVPMGYDSFYYGSPPNETLFIWNVFCRYVDGSRQGTANASWFIYANALPRVFNDTIPDQVWNEDTEKTMNLSYYFYDIEGEDFNFTILPNTILNISYQLNNVTKQLKFIPDPDWYGSRLIQIVTYDIYNRTTNSNTFYLNVTNVPDAPKIIWWNVSNATWQTQTETNLSFMENESIKFEAEAIDADLFGPAPSAWFYWFLDGVLQNIGKAWQWAVSWFAAGTHNVTLIVNDTDGLYDIQYWLVNISNLNRPPLYYPIPTLYWKQNTTKVINLDSYFYDLDLEELNYSVYGSHPQNISLNMSNITKLVFFSPDTNWIGNDSIRFMARDKWDGTNISNNVTLIVYPYLIRTLPNITFLEDGYDDSLNLTEYYNNESYNKSDLNWTINGSYNVYVNLNLITWQVNFTARLDWTGNESIMFIATHKNNYTDNFTINVEVLPRNDPPIINDTTRVIIENTVPPPNLIDLWNYSYDVDNTYEFLNYSIISNTNESLLNCSIVGDRYINCSPPPQDKWGMISLNVSVYDGEFYDYAEMNITIFHYDIPPIIVNWTATNGTYHYVNTKTHTLTYYENTWINFSAVVYDIEGDNLDYFWILNGTVMKSGSTILNTAKYNQTLVYDGFYDYHSAGKYKLVLKVNQTSGDIIGLSSSETWNIIILNNNRPPTKPNLTQPVNDSFITGLPISFDWTDSTDPDAVNRTDYDFWFVSYLMQVDDDIRFYSPNFQVARNSSSASLNSNLPDNRYYWRVIATDGDDSAISDIFTFMLDINTPQLSLSVYPNPAEYLYRNITVTWSATDTYLVDAYVNVSYPNGTLLGQYDYSPFILLPENLTVLGNYNIKLYAIDVANNSAVKQETLTVINDTTPPLIHLIAPKDQSTTASSTIIFSYTYDDYATLRNCTLYYQKIKQYRDLIGNIIYEEDLEPWESKKDDLTIDSGTNYFVVPGFSDGDYRWNVLCYDVASNGAFASGNWTFTIKKTPPAPTFVEMPATFESEERVIQGIPGYNLYVELPHVNTVPGRILDLNFTVINIGESTIEGIRFTSTVPWIEIDAEISSLPSGVIVEVPFRIRAPYKLGEYLYHVITLSPYVNTITPGYVKVGKGKEEPPIYIIKRIEPMKTHFNITISIINSLYRDVRMYIEDYITGMSEISFEAGDFYVNTIHPPALILNMTGMRANSVQEFSYYVKDMDFDQIKEPFVITDEKIQIEIQIINPTSSRIAFFKGFTLEYLFFTIFVVVMGYFYLRKRKEDKTKLEKSLLKRK